MYHLWVREGSEMGETESAGSARLDKTNKEVRIYLNDCKIFTISVNSIKDLIDGKKPNAEIRVQTLGIEALEELRNKYYSKSWKQ